MYSMLSLFTSVSDQIGTTPAIWLSLTPWMKVAGSQLVGVLYLHVAGPVQAERALRVVLHVEIRLVGRRKQDFVARAAAAATSALTPVVSQYCGIALVGGLAFDISCQPVASLPYLATIGRTLLSKVW
jgi:hypothetical protein